MLPVIYLKIIRTWIHWLCMFLIVNASRDLQLWEGQDLPFDSPTQPAISSLFLGGKILNCFLVWQVEKNYIKERKKTFGGLKGNIWVSLGRLHTTTRLRSQAMKRSVSNWSVTKLVQSGIFLFFFLFGFAHYYDTAINKTTQRFFGAIKGEPEMGFCCSLLLSSSDAGTKWPRRR